jgi:hypothetical protein
VLEKILLIFVENRTALPMIKLSMVNRYFHSEITANIKAWYQFYLHWRGPIVPRPPPTKAKFGYGVVSLRPTYPRSVPNFKDKTPRVT